MVVQDTFGGWIISEGDPDASSEVGLIDSARPVTLAESSPRPDNDDDHRSTAASSRRIALQSALVVGTAIAAGLLVFAVVRNMADSDTGSQDNAQDFNELPTVGLQQDESASGVGGSSSRSGSRRNTLEDGILVDTESTRSQEVSSGTGEGTDVAVGSAGLDVGADRDGNATSETDQPTPLNERPTVAGSLNGDGPGVDGQAAGGSQDDDSATPGDTDQAAATTAPGSPDNSAATTDDPTSGTTATTDQPATTTTDPAPSSTEPAATSTTPTTAATTTPTTAAPTTSAPSATTATTPTTIAPTTTTTVASTTVPPTVAPLTTAPSTTVSTTTTTEPPTTTTVVPQVLSVVRPVEGRTYDWERRLRLEATPQDGARSYCWTVASGGRTIEQCEDGPSTRLPGGSDGPAPGPARVTVEALDDRGEALATETVTIKLIATDLISRPSNGAVFTRGEVARVSVRKIPTATDYCISVSRSGDVIGEGCDNDRSFGLDTGAVRPGRLDIEVEVLRGNQVIGRQSIFIQVDD